MIRDTIRYSCLQCRTFLGNFFDDLFWDFLTAFFKGFFLTKSFSWKMFRRDNDKPKSMSILLLGYLCRFFFWLNSTNLIFLHYVWDFTGAKPTLWCAIRSQVRSDWCAFRIGENIGTRFLGKTRPLLSSSNTMWQSHAFSDNSQSTIVLPELPGNLIQ